MYMVHTVHASFTKDVKLLFLCGQTKLMTSTDIYTTVGHLKRCFEHLGNHFAKLFSKFS